MRKLGRIIGIVLLTLSALIVLNNYLARSRVRCEVANASGQTVTDVIVTVAGRRAVLGTLKPGESRETTLSPLDQAGGVFLAFILPDGTVMTEVLDGYIERSLYGGRVQVEIEDGGKVRIISNTIRPRIWPWFSVILWQIRSLDI